MSCACFKGGTFLIVLPQRAATDDSEPLMSAAVRVTASSPTRFLLVQLVTTITLELVTAPTIVKSLPKTAHQLVV